MEIKPRTLIRWILIAAGIIYVAYLHLERIGYKKDMDIIRGEAQYIKETAYYRTAPKDLRERINRIGSVSSEVLDIPRQAGTLPDIMDESK
ncbi:MAG: hypothetical protein GF409_07860 [Candidatus Omnitrophica bacterium]|nr:hypothetical protein [Candidatus Omnitrophota bacterium]